MGVVSNNLSAKEYKPVYLLYGEEAYLRNYYKNALKAALVSEGDNLNYSYYEGNGVDPNEVVGMIQTMPFMAEHRVVIVENTGWFAKAGGEASEGDDEKASGKTAGLQNAIKELGEDIVLIFCEEKVDKRSKLFKAVSQKGVAEEYALQTEDMLARWVANIAKGANCQMDARTAYYLVSEVGLDMLLLKNEMDKLTAWSLEKGTITIEDVDTVCTHQITNKIFDMITAIATHHQKEALNLYYDLLSLRESPFHILSLLVRQYTQMLEVKDLMNRNQPVNMIAQKLNSKDWIIKRLQDSCRRMSLKDIRNALEMCARADEDIKTGNLTDMMSVELLIVNCSK